MLDLVMVILNFLVIAGLLAVALIIGSVAGLVICFTFWLIDRRDRERGERRNESLGQLGADDPGE